ncbi:hypothetical protein TNCV_746651 [Trichonephila clavipes]|nr:hypothetical protein TNCV_746651 [Trichonephila clavipes]
MAVVDSLHHENPPTWAGVEPATLGAEGQRQTNHATQRAPSADSGLNYCGEMRGHVRHKFVRECDRYAQYVMVWAGIIHNGRTYRITSLISKKNITCHNGIVDKNYSGSSWYFKGAVSRLSV